MDDCGNFPCINGGTCVDLVDDYQCECVAGFEGLRCEVNIDDCATNPCRGNHQCVDKVLSLDAYDLYV